MVGLAICRSGVTYGLNTVPLMLLSGADYLSVFSRQELEALSYASLSLAGKQGELLTSIWGLWLFPFAVLTIKSGFLPKFLGALLMITGIAYVVSCVTAVAFPEHVATVNKLVFPFYFGEFIVVLWLAFVGAKPRTAEA